jgi:arginase/N-omega-hydroxy-L-arginine amidinohydrolase
MTIDLIVSQGRIADRTAGAIRGAARTAQALKHRYGAKAQFIGRTAPADNDDWPVSLPQARETLAGLARAIATSIEAGNLPVIVANTCAASLASLPVVARKHPDAVVL